MADGTTTEEPLLRGYDVTAVGQRFLVLKDETAPVPSQLNVVLNWHEDLKRAVALRK